MYAALRVTPSSGTHEPYTAAARATADGSSAVEAGTRGAGSRLAWQDEESPVLPAAWLPLFAGPGPHPGNDSAPISDANSHLHSPKNRTSPCIQPIDTTKPLTLRGFASQGSKEPWTSRDYCCVAIGF